MSVHPFRFPRPRLAQAYCHALDGTGIVDSRSGLFLAAPRRTGKSTFLREDLLPALDAHGWATAYVDLWTDKAADPAALIAGAVRNALAGFASVIPKLSKAVGLEKVNVFGTLSLNLQAPEAPANVTLADALEALQVAAGKPIVMVIDEAQHAIATENGMNAMFALKAARDRMNQSSGPQKLFLVFTGSNQDKLSRLVFKKDQPFYGCRISKFPLLDRSFSDALTEHVNAKLAPDNQFDNAAVFEAFRLVGNRPEMLRNVMADLALDLGADALAENLQAGALAFRSRLWSEMESEFAALSEVQRAVLVRIIEAGSNYVPFNEAALQAYAAFAGRHVSVADAQGALNALRAKNLVWQAAYGDYALEDESIGLWYAARQRA